MGERLKLRALAEKVLSQARSHPCIYVAAPVDPHLAGELAERVLDLIGAPVPGIPGCVYCSGKGDTASKAQ